MYTISEIMQKVCMYGMFIFGFLAALAALGWNYYGLKIKEAEKAAAKNVQRDSIPIIQESHRIEGDFTKGNIEKTDHSKKVIAAPNALIVTDNQVGDNKVEQYFNAKDPKDIITTPVFNSDGSYGMNVLSAEHTEFSIGKNYSFRVQIPEKTLLKVVMMKLNDDAAQWLIRLGTQKNWVKTLFENNRQEFTLGNDGEEKADLLMIFTGKGVARVSIFFNGTLLNEKTISWQ